MTGQAKNPLKNLRLPTEIKDRSLVRYVTSIVSALLFLGWLILELTLGF
ncbi:MAG: hypothetical protein N2Z75_04930 [Meiothermus sp.]|nr:hypothetical protein [Meiothermus sp.]MCS7068527.1 hypothetical protein [Meiothermus sp.]MCX7601269.1 hypothetical protein [Meiothermus sp.]MDW8424778.1 hypothetical protein [Meiothermus sp.]